MEEVLKQQTPTTPQVKITGNTLSIKGRGIPENSIEYWREIFGWLDKHMPFIKKEHKDFVLDLSFEYFSISFSKGILDFLRYFEKLSEPEVFKVRVIWNYDAEDEDIYEAGKDYAKYTQLLFKFKLAV